MEQFTSLKNRLDDIAATLVHQFDAITASPEFSEANFADWRKACTLIREQLQDQTVRIAVVGPIKSGKSTFINSLLKADYLKRGAGVVTSFVTRVHQGNELTARLRFKTWEEVNAEIEQALSFLPDWRSGVDGGEFDIRNKTDRSDLNAAMSQLTSEQLITTSTRTLNSVLLSSYLKGYNQIKAIDFSEDMTVVYAGERFSEHRNFAGNEVLAVYLKDIELQIDVDSWPAEVEIADCQGSDSPNPLHMAMIQDYLMTAHLLVYVISSRTGLRQADIRFLSMIKQMGIMDNILFVVNCDFSEHESLPNLRNLVDKVADELALIKPSPLVFSISALFTLFDADERVLSPKESLRYDQWREETEFVAFSNQERDRFEQTLQQRLQNDWYALLVANPIERLHRIIKGLADWVSLHQEVLTADTDSAQTIIGRMQRYQQKIDQIKATVRKALDGAAHQCKTEIREQVDRFFDPRYGRLSDGLNQHIRAYTVAFDSYGDHLTTAGFNQTLYLVFQDFKQSLDAYMTQTITPQIIGFLREQETMVSTSLTAVVRPHIGMVTDLLEEYRGNLGELHTAGEAKARDDIPEPEMASIKNAAGLKILPATAMLRYSAKVKTEAMMRFGLYTALNVIKKILKKPTRSRDQDAYQAFADGLRRIKRETGKSIQSQLKSYRENIKFQYLFRLVDAAADAQYQRLIENFNACVADLSELRASIDEKRIDKERVYQILENVKEALAEANTRIAGLDFRQLEITN